MNFSFEKGVLVGQYTKGTEIDLEYAKKAVKMRKKFSNFHEFPVPADARSVKSVTKEARDYFSSEEGQELIVAAAIMSDSVFPMYLANFLIKVNLVKSSIPIKLFTNKSDAFA